MNEQHNTPEAASETASAEAHPWLHVAFYEPEIPANTGNIMRLCANTGCILHLIEPMGFVMDDRKLKRAGMDYRDIAVVQQHRDLSALRQAMPTQRLIAFSTKGSTIYSDYQYQKGDILLFGPESRGLPQPVLAQSDAVLRLPMRTASRSLNLSNTTAIAVYEAWRQLGFC